MRESRVGGRGPGTLPDGDEWTYRRKNISIESLKFIDTEGGP